MFTELKIAGTIGGWIGKKVLPFLIVAAVVYFGWQHISSSIYNEGWNARDAVADAEKARSDADYKRRIEEAEDKAEKTRVESQTQILRIINEKNERTKKLESDIANLNDQRLFVNAKRTKPARDCSDRNVQADQDTGQPGSGASRVELSGEASRNVRRDYFNGQRVVGQYLDVRDLILTNPQCFEVVD
ncbi:hypothetical protein SAMN05216302_10466 [Nitrosomonas aestuarii]|uniref:Bacteriophage Rz lysis protein n=1 Tax=Nitrosomonas aestuarii TaxID=52441 RepID=A0A1I4G3Z3_9PROT|nr:hypothetical protein [Nitrosomonas aestuarii]SFL23781.1 hypothetical protein SAMN05216302_10466 [Nitrosomonas aestuarii]